MSRRTRIDSITGKGVASRAELLTRRRLLEDLVKATLAGAVATSVAGCATTINDTVLPLMQPHYLDMSDDELAMAVKRIEDEVFALYAKRPEVHSEPAPEDTRWVMTLDLSRCVGCGRCRRGCHEENNQSRDPAIFWISMLKSQHMKVWLLHETEDYDTPPQREDDGSYYLPQSCQQCETSQCVRACPVKATWKEPDGITVVDYNWCIGCRYCMATCPYGARKFNWAHPVIPATDLNPHMHYLGNRPRMYGVIEKCTFCVQRTRMGHDPACCTVCPVGARTFGNVLDPTSEVHYIVNNVRTIQLKEELGTNPRFYYYFSAGQG
jgi:molybdopterin-containing oxidoreductase family iron-sulfur binding subunit